MASVRSDSDTDLSDAKSIFTPDTTPLRNRAGRQTKLIQINEETAQPVETLSVKEELQVIKAPGVLSDALNPVSDCENANEASRADQPSKLPDDFEDILNSVVEKNPRGIKLQSHVPKRWSAVGKFVSPNAQVNLAKTAPDSLGKRKREDAPKLPPIHFEPPYIAATEEEKSTWGGFCEIESDPAVFNNVLRGFGVEGVSIREVWSLSDQISSLPKPVYGLIFLFQYTSEADAGEQVQECPQHVWFANQVVDNCCGTIALLNVVNNISSDVLLLSEEFKQFKNFTSLFPPTLRGEQVANCNFIKRAHNAYARKIDMLNADLLLEENWTQGQKKKPRVNGRGGAKKKKNKKPQADSAFHFVAYMPIEGEIWRMDGLDGFPQSLGRCETGEENWLHEIEPILSARMLVYGEDGVQYSMLAVVRNDQTTLKTDIVGNVQLLRAVEDKLQTLNSEWKSFAEYPEGVITLPTSEYAFLEHHLPIELDENIKVRLQKFDDLTSLLELHRKTAQQQASLKEQLQNINKSDDSALSEEIRALDRQNDYVPFIQKWMFMLANNQELRELVEAY